MSGENWEPQISTGQGEYAVNAKIRAAEIKKLALQIVKGLAALVLVVGLGLGVAMWAGAFGERIEPGHTEVSTKPSRLLDDYTVDQVHPVDQPYYAEAVGTLKAASRTEISARVMGEIKVIHVRAGDVVEKDDVVVELDREALAARHDQAKAALSAAEAALGQADTEYERALRLSQADPGAITDQTLKQVAYELETAKANKSGADQSLTEARVLLSYTTIKAPKAGTIVERFAEQGDVARPGVPILELYDPASLRLEVPVMENLAIKLKEGDELTVKIDALDQKAFTATVDEIVPQAEAASRSFLVKVKLPPSPDLFEGMYGRLMIPAGVRRHLCLNAGAIERIGQLEFVHVVDSKGRNPERRYIKTGRFGRPGRIEVLSGLKANEHVLVKTPSSRDDPLETRER
jgi:RND family efflux transporter MFP subunit